MAYCAPFYQFFVTLLNIFWYMIFFSKWCQTKIAIFRDFFIYNYRFRKKHFSVENNHNIMKLHTNLYFRVSFKVNKVFWKIGIFTRTGTIKQFLKFGYISPWCRRVVKYVYWFYMYTIRIYIKRAFFWVVKRFFVISCSKDIKFFPNCKFIVTSSEKIEKWYFHAPGWAEKRFDPGGKAQT